MRQPRYQVALSIFSSPKKDGARTWDTCGESCVALPRGERGGAHNTKPLTEGVLDQWHP